MGEAYGARPSTLLAVDDEWAAYQLDAAAFRFGAWVESRLDRKLPIDWMDAPRPRETYPDPIPILRQLGGIRRGQVPDSGVW